MAVNVENSKKKRINLSIIDRATILQRLDAKEKAIELAKEYNVTKSAISLIKKRKNNILKAKNDLETCEGNLKKLRYTGAEVTILEKKLYTWFKQQRSMGFPVSGPILKTKALIFNERLGGASKFKASGGWLDAFKKRHGIRHLSIQGEKLSADLEGSEEFKTKLVNMMSISEISPDCVYNCDETELYWKLLPNKTFVSKAAKNAESRKKPKNRVTVQMASNATGTHKIPLFLIGKYEKPQCLRGIKNLLVVYANQKSSLMDKFLMRKWYTLLFMPEVIKFHDLQNNPDKKIFLIMDNASCHTAAELDGIFPSCTILFLPPNATSLIQPLAQGIIEKFKKCYRKIFLNRFLADDVSNESIENLLDKFNLVHCCNYSALAWNEVTPENIAKCWKKTISPDDDSAWEMESVDGTALHTLIMRIPELRTLTIQDTTDWLQVDAHENGWQSRTDEDIILKRLPDENIKEMDDRVVNEDLELTNEDGIILQNSSAADALKSLDQFLHWYQIAGDDSPSTLQTLLSCYQSLLIKFVEEKKFIIT